MDIASIPPAGYLLAASPSIGAEDTALRRQLMQATRAVNESGALGRNQLVFVVDPRTHRPIIRVEDRETHAVVFQAPPDYVLRLAQELGSRPTQTTEPPADM